MDPVTGLSLGRIALGAVALASPATAAKLLRLDARANPQLAYMTRMFGSREIAVGAVTLLAPAAAQPRLVAMGIAIDGADTVAGVMAGVSGSVPKSTSVLLTLPAVAAVATGIAALGRRQSATG